MQGKCGPRQTVQPLVACPASLTREGDERSMSRRTDKRCYAEVDEMKATRRRGRRRIGVKEAKERAGMMDSWRAMRLNV
jgi:hypothetical protein